jgi:hypothetical protein
LKEYSSARNGAFGGGRSLIVLQGARATFAEFEFWMSGGKAKVRLPWLRPSFGRREAKNSPMKV